MSVAVALHWEPGTGADEKAYWEVTDKLGVRDTLPPGCEYHIVGSDPAKGFMVLEVWESEEAFGRFAQGELRAAIEEVGAPAPDRITVLPLIRQQGA